MLIDSQRLNASEIQQEFLGNQNNENISTHYKYNFPPALGDSTVMAFIYSFCCHAY